MTRSSLTPHELARLARLARIGLDQDELLTFSRDVSEILAHAEAMTTRAPAAPSSAPRTDGTEGSTCREDSVHAWRGRVLDETARLSKGHVVVARVL